MKIVTPKVYHYNNGNENYFNKINILKIELEEYGKYISISLYTTVIYDIYIAINYK